MNRAVIYARTATKDGPIESQVERCAAHAAMHGWEVTAIYRDVGVGARRMASGKTDRSEMLAAAEHGAFQVLVVEDLDRLSRDARDLHALMRRLDDLGVAVFTVSGGLLSDLKLGFGMTLATGAGA